MSVPPTGKALSSTTLFGACLNAHSWSPDRSSVAVSTDSSEFHIFSVPSDDSKVDRTDLTTWTRTQVLDEHHQTVSALHWGPVKNRVLSASHDRNAYVWSKIDNIWKPELVLLKLDRAALDIKWSPQENKFAAASSDSSIAICYYDEANNFWVSKKIRGNFSSAVLTLDWDPTGAYVAAGSSDRRVVLFSAFISGEDRKEIRVQIKEKYGDKSFKFGTAILEYECSGWVKCVRFSPDGNWLAIASYDSSLTILNLTLPSTSPDFAQVLKLSSLPYTAILFASPTTFVAAGHDANPAVYGYKQSKGKWEFVGKLDSDEKKAGGEEKNSTRQAFEKFQVQDSQGLSAPVDSTLPTRHQNLITSLAASSAANASGTVTEFTSVGRDGQLLFWTLDELSESLKSLSL